LLLSLITLSSFEVDAIITLIVSAIFAFVATYIIRYVWNHELINIKM
jgi:hypothetical protein